MACLRHRFERTIRSEFNRHQIYDGSSYDDYRIPFKQWDKCEME